jgi:hypothetical protein
MPFFIALTWLAIVCAGPRPSAQQQFSAAGIDDPKLVSTFLSDLQQAVAADDAARVAGLAAFPVEVSIGIQRRSVRSIAEFRTLYSQIFNPCVKRIVAAATPDDLSASWRGVMLGGGAIWFGLQQSGQIRFFTINGAIADEGFCKEGSPAGAPGFVDKVWRVEKSSGGAVGTLYVFLSDGTLLIASATGTPALGAWTYEGGVLTMIEEGIPYKVDILASSPEEFRIRSHNPAGSVDIALTRAKGPAPKRQ